MKKQNYIVQLLEVHETKSAVYLVLDYDTKKFSMLNYQKFVKQARQLCVEYRDKKRRDVRKLKKEKLK